MKKCLIILVATFLMACPLSVLAADMPLLNEELTRLTTSTGEVSYTPEGALTLLAADDSGASAAIDPDMPVSIYETPFVQLSITSSAPFNLAFKLSGGEYTIFPQTAGPSWYEAFQEEPPADGKGVAAGSYTFSLDLRTYIRYNDLSVPEDGKVTLETVFVKLQGAGALTIEHLLLSNNGEFQTSLGKTGATAYQPIAITTAAPVPTRPTQPTYDAGGVTRYQSEGLPIGMIVMMIVAAAAVIGMVVWSVVRAKQTASTDSEE